MRYLLPFLLLITPGWAQPQLDEFETKPSWSDEFNVSGRPDSSKWNFQLGNSGWGNQELQNYTERNATVAGGRLTITARKECGAYTSARLNSKGKGDFLYGRIVARARLPRGCGTWPAIWTLYSEDDSDRSGWPGNGEIDIMEHVGFDPGRIHGSIHSKAFNHIDHTQKTATLLIPDAETAFHDYELRWTPDWIETRVDDQVVLLFKNPHQSWREWPFDRPQHLLLNVAVGGFWGGMKGIDDSIWPQALDVDYVRYYPYKP